MPNKKGALTPMEKVFVERYAATGDATYAAAKAGYGTPVVRGSQNLAKPGLQDAIRREQLARLNNEALPLALDHFIDTLSDPKATKRDKTAVAAIVVKHTLGPSGDAGEAKEPHEMSSEEIRREIERLKREAAERTRVTIEATANESQEASVFD